MFTTLCTRTRPTYLPVSCISPPGRPAIASFFDAMDCLPHAIDCAFGVQLMHVLGLRSICSRCSLVSYANYSVLLPYGHAFHVDAMRDPRQDRGRRDRWKIESAPCFLPTPLSVFLLIRLWRVGSNPTWLYLGPIEARVTRRWTVYE